MNSALIAIAAWVSVRNTMCLPNPKVIPQVLSDIWQMPEILGSCYYSAREGEMIAYHGKYN